jgi:hypothetical protein
MSLPRGFLGVTGCCPDGQGECQFLVSMKYVTDLQRIGPSWKFWNLHLLDEILKKPTVIFEGLNRQELDKGYCYSGIASKRMQSKTIALPPPPDLVAVVFVNPDPRGLIVLDWEWRRADPDKPGWPIGWSEHFVRPCYAR